MKFYTTLESVLKSNSELQLIDNQGDLMLNKIHDLVDKTDENLIGLLLENQELREKFFIKIKNVYVFKTNDFKFFLDENKIDNSYTQYENRIGLTAGGKFLKDSSDVVLDFPYKDCILEGGQSSEEGTDTYFEYDQKDEHYLEKQAKRKEIFFNTVLAKDEIDRLLEPKAFANIKKHTTNGEENITSFERDENGTIKDNLIIKGNNLLALHTLKSEFAGKVKLIYIDPPYNTGNDSFAYNDNFNHSTWLTFMKSRLEAAKILLSEDGSILVQADWNEIHYLKVLLDSIFEKGNFRNEIIWLYHGPGSPKMKQYNRKHDSILWYSKSNSNWIFNGDDVRMSSEVHVGGFNNEMSSDVSSEYTNKGKIPEDWWEMGRDKEEFVEEMSNLYEEYEKIQNKNWWKIAVAARIRVDGKKRSGYLTEKPYKLIERFIKAHTNENDIVLDFFAGSGTTGFVSNYLNRQFILIEQLENTHQIIKERFEGFDYTYLELAKNNQNAIEQIQSCESYEDLVAFFNEMCDKYFLHYNVKVKDFKEKICKEENFKKLTLDQQKIMFAKMLDLNQLYVNVSDMEDKKFALSKDDIAFTKDFYQL